MTAGIYKRIKNPIDNLKGYGKIGSISSKIYGKLNNTKEQLLDFFLNK